MGRRDRWQCLVSDLPEAAAILEPQSHIVNFPRFGPTFCMPFRPISALFVYVGLWCLYTPSFIAADDGHIRLSDTIDKVVPSIDFTLSNRKTST